MTTRRKNVNVVTDFQFPPTTAGAWRALSRAQRERWLIAACNRHFKWLGRRGPRDAPAGTVFQVDGSQIADLPAFFCALGEAINGPGGYFGGMNSLSLQDCLHGAFGVTLPFVLQITSADVCRRNLDGRALAARARQCIAARDFLDPEGEEWLLRAEHQGREGSRTLFDDIAEELQSHGVVLHIDGIELPAQQAVEDRRPHVVAT